MSYLTRLKQHLAENPPAPPNPFESFEGGRSARVSPNSPAGEPFEGFEGGEGARVRGSEAPGGTYVYDKKKERSSKYLLVEQKKGGTDGAADGRTRPPEAPSKPPKGGFEGADPVATVVPAIPRQTDIFRCFICGVHETAEKPLLPVLSEIRGEHHWLHRGCWPEHSHRCAQARAAAVPASRERIAS